MIANLYLPTDSIRYNGVDSEEEVENKLKSFIKDLVYIEQYKSENIIYIGSDIYETKITSDKNIFAVAEMLAYEESNLIYSVLGNTSEMCLNPLTDLIEACQIDTDEECTTIIAFNTIQVPDTVHYIIYDKTSWFTFRRVMLGKHHKNDPVFFIEECRKYFKELYFHENNKVVVGKYLPKSAIKFIKYLTALNDSFKDYKVNNPGVNTNDMLANFSRLHEMDDLASLQANPSKKPHLTFVFDAINSNTKLSYKKSILCEPHLKICYPDNPTDPDRYDYCARIYFHFGDSEVQNGKVLIGSIGPHV